MVLRNLSEKFLATFRYIPIDYGYTGKKCPALLSINSNIYDEYGASSFDGPYHHTNSSAVFSRLLRYWKGLECMYFLYQSMSTKSY